MKRFGLVASFVGASMFAASTGDHPTGNRTTPPTLNSVSPLGVPRGAAAEITVEGLNLAKASAIYFSEPGIAGKILRVKELPDLSDVRLGSNGTRSTIDLGPLPPRNEVTVQLDVSRDAEIGAVRFRLQTPLGTTPEGRFLIEPPFAESLDKEPDDAPENAVETKLPAILVGAISKPGDVDYFKVQVKAGEQLVFENGAALIGSTLEPVVTILGADQSVIRRFGMSGGMDAVQFAHRFEKAGTYYVRVADFQESGKRSHFYRIKVGDFPLVSRTYPLGLGQGQTREISLKGYNVASKINVTGETTPANENLVTLRPGHSLNEVRLAVGPEPEVEANGSNRLLALAQQVSLPVTINGRLDGPAGHYYRFHARKGQKLVLEVNARRLGSDLDSFLEVLDAKGNPIEQATVRALIETSTTLAERDSSTRGIRIQSRAGLSVGDYLMIGGEIVRLEEIPDSPDADVIVEGSGGQRIAYFDTSTEAHAIDKPVYKVQVYPPGKRFTPNGLPLVHLYYQNDDGGPGYGKDSVVHFAAPDDSDYIVRLRDIRGESREDSAYRLTIRDPRPDFRLTVNPRNPNVPVGGCIPITVTARRMDGFDGPIDIALQDLPPGIRASTGVIAPREISTTLLLSAAPDAKMSAATLLKVAGRAGSLSHVASPDDPLKLISLMSPADVVMTANTTVVEIEPGKTAEIAVEIQRQNGFAGRVPVAIMNLPTRVKLTDIGLNGVLLNETETRRSFTILALPNAEPTEQWIYVGGVVETRSNLPSVYAAPQPILLKVVTHRSSVGRQ